MQTTKTYAAVWLALVLSGCGSAAASLCDSAQLKLTCQHPNGQCVEFSGLSTSDQQANASGCDTSGTPCPTAGRLGTCKHSAVRRSDRRQLFAKCRHQHPVLRAIHPGGRAVGLPGCPGDDLDAELEIHVHCARPF